MEKEPQEYEDEAQDATEAPGEGSGWEEPGADEASDSQSTRADK